MYGLEGGDEMKVAERIETFRAIMLEQNIDAYLIPTSDNHQSEYVSAHFKVKDFMTGFTGSAGDVVITKDKVGLWTDSRYFIQAKQQLEGSGVTLYRKGEPDTLSMKAFLLVEIPQNGTLGCNGQVLAAEEGTALKEALSEKKISLCYDKDLVDMIWDNRPAFPSESVFILSEKYSGESTVHKLERVREAMSKNCANVHVIASLDDICWLLNIRGKDIAHTPLVLSYVIVYMDAVDLFIDESKLSEDIKEQLRKNGCRFLPYEAVYKTVQNLTASDTLLLDSSKLNYALYNCIPDVVLKVNQSNPAYLFKAIKNNVEIENTIRAHIKDGVAVTKFMYWLKNTVGKEKITEMRATEKLEEFRKAGEGYLWQSFAPICAYKEHAAIVHYSATKETDKELNNSHMFLADTGGNYYEGSTDITRTIILGEISEQEKLHFTLVAKAMINLANAKFLHGVKGFNLDILAKKPLWERGLDYKHGTGHGVGHLLNIHEGPAGFHWRIAQGKNETHELEAGMVITDEPGIYIEGSHGIRTENELVVRNGECNEFGQFMYFETITYVPIDLDGIDVTLLNEEERVFLNAYHKMVFDTISPYLEDELKAWLKEYTRDV